MRVMHTFREGNSCADFLAKEGAQQDLDFNLLAEPPPGLFVLLAKDAAGFLVARP